MFIRIFIGLFASLVVLVSVCSAMQFSQLVELGRIGGDPGGGFEIDGADYNNGSFYKGQRGRGALYEKGVARFGDERNALWVYYDCSRGKGRTYREAYTPLFGNKERTVGVNLRAGEGDGIRVYSIKNDCDITLFFVAGNGCVFGAEHYVIMGYNKEGKFVKYIDIREIAEKYLGKRNMGMKGAYLGRYYCRDDTIIAEYIDPRISKDFQTPVGEFRFQWDEKAQWFGVEHVVY